jgi:tetratricopeptide (TPR) repeat protein
MGIAVRTAIAALAFGLIAACGPARAMTDSLSSEPDPKELYKKAVEAVDMKRYKEAIGHLEAVLKDDPKNADALNVMGFSHRKLGEYDLAVRYYTKALDAKPDHRGANEYLGEAYLEINKLPEAEARLAKLNQICGAECKETKALAEAVASYKAGKRPPQSSRAW